MKVFQIADSGKLEILDITRKALVSEFSIHNRDLRPVFLSKQISTMSVRGDCVILNLGTIKCIIGPTNAYFFNTEHQSTQTISENIAEKLKNSEEAKNSSFEFIVLDNIFTNRFDQLNKAFQSAERSAQTLLNNLKKKFSENHLESLLSVKKRILGLETKVEETQKPIVDILEDEEEIALLDLSKKRQTKQQKQENVAEIESILENYTEQLEDILHKIADLTEHIDDTQEFITLKMANIRNTIIRFDLFISIITATFAVPSVLVGLYGMNIVNKLETSEQAFFHIVIMIMVFVVLMFFGSLWYLRKKKILN